MPRRPDQHLYPVQGQPLAGSHLMQAEGRTVLQRVAHRGASVRGAIHLQWSHPGSQQALHAVNQRQHVAAMVKMPVGQQHRRQALRRHIAGQRRERAAAHVQHQPRIPRCHQITRGRALRRGKGAVHTQTDQLHPAPPPVSVKDKVGNSTHGHEPLPRREKIGCARGAPPPGKAPLPITAPSSRPGPQPLPGTRPQPPSAGSSPARPSALPPPTPPAPSTDCP